MIKLNDRFSMRRNNYCWVMTDKGLSGKSRRTTYHANFAQIAHVVLQRSGQRCENIEELKALYANATTILIDQLEEQIRVRITGEATETDIDEEPEDA